MRVHQVRLDLAQRVVLQIVEEQRAEHDQYQLDAADAEQYFQHHQLQMRQFEQNRQRQDDVPLLLLVLALLLAPLWMVIGIFCVGRKKRGDILSRFICVLYLDTHVRTYARGRYDDCNYTRQHMTKFIMFLQLAIFVILGIFAKHLTIQIQLIFSFLLRSIDYILI